MPKHFNSRGAAEYNYKKRTPKYLRRKNKRGKPPLVLTGKMRSRAKSVKDIRTNKKGGKVVMRGFDRYVFQYRNSAGGPKKFLELVAVSSQDEVFLRNQFERFVVRALNRKSGAGLRNITKSASGAIDLTRASVA